jgi:tetratricopeptide (TPR) repeat protein
MILAKNKTIWEENKEEPKSYSTLARSYYTLANFYEKNGNAELAQEMYKERIRLDTKDPEGYHYFVGFLQNQRRWEEAMVNHERRLYAILAPDIIDIVHEIDQLKVDTEEVRRTTEFIDTVKKNKRVDAEEKQRLLTEAEERIKDKLPVDEAEKKLEELDMDLKKKIKRAEATADTLEAEAKQKVAETYYSIGNVCWNWSYQTPADFMSPELRRPIIEKGLSSLDKATKLTPEYSDPYAYMGLLWREMIKVDPLKRDEFLKKNEEFNKKFTDIYKRKKRQEEYKKQLEDMGQDQG